MLLDIRYIWILKIRKAIVVLKIRQASEWLKRLKNGCSSEAGMWRTGLPWQEAWVGCVSVVCLGYSGRHHPGIFTHSVDLILTLILWCGVVLYFTDKVRKTYRGWNYCYHFHFQVMKVLGFYSACVWVQIGTCAPLAITRESWIGPCSLAIMCDFHIPEFTYKHFLVGTKYG